MVLLDKAQIAIRFLSEKGHIAIKFILETVQSAIGFYLTKSTWLIGSCWSKKAQNPIRLHAQTSKFRLASY